MQLDAAAGSVADVQSQQLSYQLRKYCTYIVEATSEAKATQFLNGVVDSATALDIRPGRSPAAALTRRPADSG